MKKNNKKGFTLAELLIVVAIIAVLTAIAIPIFTGQLNKSKYSSDLANARSIYSELSADYLANGGTQTSKFGTETGPTKTDKVTINQNNTDQMFYLKEADGTENVFKFNGACQVEISTGSKGPYVAISKAVTGDTAVSFGSSGT